MATHPGKVGWLGQHDGRGLRLPLAATVAGKIRPDQVLRGQRGAPEARDLPVVDKQVTLLDTDPPVWRRLLVPTTIRLDRLDRVIQAAMGWTNSHAGRLVTDGTYDTAEAAQARVQRLDHLNRAVKLRIGAPPPTLTEWTTTWLPAHLAGTATLAKYESMLRCHILPAFGSHRLDAISRTEVKAFARALSDRLAPITVRSIVSVLRLVLREAIDEHYLLFDPTARLRLRDGPDEPRPTATPDQVRRLAARMPNLHARALVITAA